MKRQILSLDISDDFVAAVVVRQSGQEKKIVSCAVQELRSRSHLAEVLPELLDRINWSGGSCVCGISLDGVSLRNLTVPFADRKKLSQVLPLELEDQLLVPVDEQIIEYVRTASTEAGSRILVAGLEKDQLRRDLDALHLKGMRPGCITLRNFAFAELLIRTGSLPPHFLLADMGTFSINILFVQHGRVVFIRRLACPDRMFAQVPLVFDPGKEDNSNVEEVRSCLAALCDDIRRSMGFYQLESETDFQPELVVLTGSMAELAVSRETVSTELELDVVPADIVETARIKLAEDVRDQWMPPVMNHALALALEGFRKKHPFNFCKGEFAPDRLFFASMPQLAIAAGIIVFLLGAGLVLLGFDYNALKTRNTALEGEMTTLYKQTFPEATRIVDPLVQMQANVRDVQAPSIATPVFSGRKRALDILSEISAGVDESIKIQVSRLVIDQESVQIKGITDTFNNVNLIQGSLRKSPLFIDASIVSAAAEKKSGMIRFELRLQLKGQA